VRAAGLTGSRAGGMLAVVGPGWSGTGAWTSYAPAEWGRGSLVADGCGQAAPGKRGRAQGDGL
jgi:hypothetical protein